MMRTILAVILFVAVSGMTGCTNKNSETQKTECHIIYKLKTFPIDHDVLLNVDRVKYDRWGRMSVRVSRGQVIEFFGSGYLSEGTFVNKDCK